MSVAEGMVAVKMPSKFDDSIRIKLEDGDWYSATQSIADSIRKGATVKIKFERRGKNLVIDKVKELSAPSGNPQGNRGSGGGNRGGGGFGGGNANPEREASIHYQSARKDALAMLAIMQETGVLKLGQKAAEKEGLLMATLDRLTAQFFKDIEDRGAVKRYSEEADEGTDFEPDEDDEEAPESDDDFGDDGDDDDF